MSNTQSHITIRMATDADADALSTLAELDSGRVPARPVLTAHVDGELRAAISMADGSAVADPFHSTADLVAMLRMRAGHSTTAARSRIRSLGRSRRPQREPRTPRPSSPSVPGIPVLPAPR